MKKIFCTIILLLIAITLDAQHKTLTLYYPDDSTNVISISNLDSMSIFICGVSKISYGGKDYNTVLIGDQCWLKENLDVGTMTQGVNNQMNNGVIEKYCYNDDISNCATYGALYQWNETMQYVTTEAVQGICPTDWHIPTLAEFQTLAAVVEYDGNALKAIGQGSFEGQGTNTSGFSALLAGYRDYYGNFYPLGDYAFFWSSTAYNANYAHQLYLVEMQSNIYMYNSLKAYGHSVRCLKD